MMQMSHFMQGYCRKRKTPATAGTIVSFLRLATVGVALACALAPVGFAQEEMEREELDELEGLFQEAEEVFTEERAQFLAQEFPAVMTLLEKYRKVAASETSGMDAKWRFLELQRDLGYMADELQETRKYQPERYPRLKQYYALEQRARELADTYHETTQSEDRVRIEGELRSVLEQAFALSQSDRESEAKEVEAEVARVWALLETRRQHKDAIIDRRLSELILGEDPYDW